MVVGVEQAGAERRRHRFLRRRCEQARVDDAAMIQAAKAARRRRDHCDGHGRPHRLCHSSPGYPDGFAIFGRR